MEKEGLGLDEDFVQGTQIIEFIDREHAIGVIGLGHIHEGEWGKIALEEREIGRQPGDALVAVNERLEVRAGRFVRHAGLTSGFKKLPAGAFWQVEGLVRLEANFGSFEESKKAIAISEICNQHPIIAGISVIFPLGINLQLHSSHET